MLHHSLTRDSGTVSWQAIRRYHTEDLHWSDIGYHFGIERVDDQYEVFVGRPLNVAGAHCREAYMNLHAIGICCVGNFDEVEPEPQLLYTLTNRLIVPLLDVLNINDDAIVLHRDYATYKSCPGKLFDRERLMAIVRSQRR